MRFPEFAKNDDWLSLKIYEVCKITTGTFDANAMSNSGKFPFFTCAKEVYRIDKYTFDAEALLVSGNGANVGYIHYCNGKFSAYQRTYVLWDFNINIFFVKYFLEGFLKARIFKERRDGNTPYIVLDTLRKFKFYAPKLEEQTKIAIFLSLIDKRIELQNKIIRDYKLLKKLMNDRLIYKNENKVMLPLNEFATLKNGYAFKGNINFKDGKYSVITITNVTGDRLCNIKNINKVNHLPLDIQKHQILKSTDILISLTGNVGRVSYCGINNGLLNQRVGLLEIFDKQKVEYIFQALSNKEFEKRMISLAQGGSQLNLSKNDIEKYKIPLVSDVEANKISNLLMRYDLKILLGKNSLSNYKKVKKFLLMQLFI